MNNDGIEYLILAFFLLFQGSVFLWNIRKIFDYEHIIAANAVFRLISVDVTDSLIADAESRDFYADEIGVQQYHLTDEHKPVSVNLIGCKNASKSLQNILAAINRYLIHNNMAAADFHLIKDITERNMDAAEEDINQTISIPLYLGLMSTMIGIIIGLTKMPNLDVAVDPTGKDILLNQGITMLIGGVRIAMIASFVGLGLTILSSGWVFKGSRNKVENRKNAFYSFIQTALLPVMNQSIGASLNSLQHNLLRFNDEFAENLQSLSGIFRQNYDALVMQENILREINELDMVKLSRFNLDMFREVERSVKEFEKFNLGMSNLNEFVDSSKMLSERVTDLMKRSENFERIAEALQDRLYTSEKLLKFLGDHFETLSEHKDLVVTAVGDTSVFVSNLFRELQAHFRQSGQELKLHTTEELLALKAALADSRTSLSNLEFLKQLDQLEQLASLKRLDELGSLQSLSDLDELKQLSELKLINKGVATFNENAAFQTQTTALLKELNGSIGEAVKLVEQVHADWMADKNSGIGGAVKRLFRRQN
ncbi:hypothetical protein FO440_22250 [Mucilaginibacter corticis]|uniref:MotA/TolQ/ExbB proton channel domain-containing protein n=1 Tax=Mucilaginibacter corticis TaxID=2597670 RepID=A0A556M9H8_9SPHI|nr:hypothetical protein [Mucilaginibacter corticis]TSJ36553.1 hypothetical protein FO440_22250 [Mucilaginibacter corticis]